PPGLSASFFCDYRLAHRDPHSFPTRRSSDLIRVHGKGEAVQLGQTRLVVVGVLGHLDLDAGDAVVQLERTGAVHVAVQIRIRRQDRKSTRLNSSHVKISYAVFCLKKKTTNES